MPHNLHQLQCRALQLIVVVAAGAVLGIVGMTPLRTSAHTSAVAGIQMARDSALSPGTVVLKHRRTVHVNIQNLAFGPARIVVSPGTKIVWTNQDGFQHTTTSDRGLWDSGPINSGAHFGRLFKKVGTFTYHCTIHPFMHGTITVSK